MCRCCAIRGGSCGVGQQGVGNLGVIDGTGRLVDGVVEVTAADVGLSDKKPINGWAFTQFDGTVHWDKAGIVTTARQGARQFESLAAWSSTPPEPSRSPPAAVSSGSAGSCVISAWASNVSFEYAKSVSCGRSI